MTGERYIREVYNDKLSWNGADPVTVTRSESNQGIDFILKLGAFISGKVVDGQSGLPVSGMEVVVDHIGWGRFGKTKTDSNVRYTIRGLLDGAVTVAIKGLGYVEQRRSVTVSGGQDVMGMDF